MVDVKYSCKNFTLKGNDFKNSGIDLYVNEVEDKGNFIIVKTGTRVQPPEGYYFDMVPRSSTFKRGLILYNNVGVIDQSYTGEIMAIFLKTPDYDDSKIPKEGERLVQLLLRRVYTVNLIESADEFELTERGEKGFGSSGK